MSKIVEFSELLVTKLCHDLAGAIGAVDNGVEFLREISTSKEINKKAIDLLTSSSNEAVSKLKFFRYIYGMTSDYGESDLSDIKGLVNSFYKNTKYNFNWTQGKSETGVLQLSNQASRMMCNMLYITTQSMISAGDLNISILPNKNSGKEIVIEAYGDKFVNIKTITQILDSHEQRDLELENVQIHLAAKIATSLDVIIRCEYIENKKLTLRVLL